jgi:hypothetical protein
VARLAALVSGRGACRHPDGTARMITTSLMIFDADVTRAVDRCPALALRLVR